MMPCIREALFQLDCIWLLNDSVHMASFLNALSSEHNFLFGFQILVKGCMNPFRSKCQNQ